MKKIVMFLVGMALLSIVTVGFAQVRSGSVTVSPTIGGYMFEGNEDMDNSLSVGLRAGYNFTKHIGIEGFAHYVPTQITGTNEDVNFVGYGVEGLYHFLPDGKLVPFLALGVGGAHYSKATEDTTGAKRDKITADYGAGLKYFVTEDIALRADVRHVIPFDSIQNNLLYTVGLSFSFGGAKKAAPVVEEVKPQPAAPAVVEEVKPEPAAPAVVEEVKPESKVAKEIMEKGRTTLNVEFDFDKSTIKKNYYKDIDDLAAVMKEYPDVKIEIAGHTDSIGTAAYNKKLSQRRAHAIKKYMVEKSAIAADRLTAKGYGEDKPIASNKTKEGRQKNRRVEAVADYIIEK
jgi:OOP family OmpA-OmpF porin